MGLENVFGGREKRKEDADDVDDSDEDESCLIEKNFAETTTCHGVPFWYSSTNSLQRIFWILVVIGMVSAMISQVFIQVSAYYDYKSSTDFSTEFLQSIDFPAVTICNYNRYFATQRIDLQELMAIRALNSLTTPGGANQESVNFSSLQYFKRIPGFTVSSYLDARGYQLRSLIELFVCRFKWEPCTPVDFRPVLTNSGKCYTFNADPKIIKQQTIAGTANGLFMIVNALHWFYTESSDGRQEAGIRFQIHNKHVPPDVDKFGIAVPVGTKAYAAVTRKDLEIMHKPWGQCDPENQKILKFFEEYSFETCMHECLTKQVIEKCNCRTFNQYWAADSAPECSLEQMRNCSSPLLAKLEQDLQPSDCSCTIPCTFTEYPVKVSYSEFPNVRTSEGLQQLLNQSAKYMKENYLSLDISFENIGFTKETQSKQIDESSLLSDIGGQIGLWIGMSLVTIVEFLQYFVLRACACAKMPAKTKKKKEKSAKSNGHTNMNFDSSSNVPTTIN